MAAYADALGATSKPWATWYVIPSDSKSRVTCSISSILRRPPRRPRNDYPQPAQDYSDGSWSKAKGRRAESARRHILCRRNLGTASGSF